MIERKTLLDILEKNQQTRPTKTSLPSNILPVMDEKSEDAISSFLEGIERASSFLMDNTKHNIDKFLQNDLRELTGQDIVIELLSLETMLEEIGKVVSLLKVEADLVKMSYEDAYNEAYSTPYDGTVNDRNAFAESKTTYLRYLSYAKMSLYTTLQNRLNSLKRQAALIEKLLWNGIRDQS